VAGDLVCQRLEYRYKSTHPQTASDVVVPTSNIAVSLSANAAIVSTPLTLDLGLEKDASDEFRIDKKRVLATACTGLFWVAPISMVWFPFLHRLMGRHFKHLVEGSLRFVVTKVALENSCLAIPICLGYFTIPALVEGEEQLNALPSRLKNDFLPSLTTDVCFWSCMSPINYKFIPVRFQPTFSCTLGGFEAAGLSFLAHRQKDVDNK